MTRRRWIADEFEGDRAALVGEHALHLVRVLRARVGQEFDIATGEGVRRGRITAMSDGAGKGEARVEFELVEDVEARTNVPTSAESGSASTPRVAPAVVVVLAIFKFDRMEWAIEKCTELGVSAIVPIIARRTDSHLARAAEKRVERWRRIALQASEQSRRSTVPEIGDPVKLASLVNHTDTDAHLPKTGRYGAPTRIVLAESEEEVSLAQLAGDGEGPVVLAVGPEGGWTDEELAMFAKAGWVSASLGANILRAETAAVAAVAVLTLG